MTTRRILVIGVVLLLTVSAVFARGKPVTEPEGTTSAAAMETNEFGWVVPEKTLEFDFYWGQENPDNVARWSEVIDKFLLGEFNVKINTIAYDNDVTERLNLMLASNDYPEVIACLNASQAKQWKDLGKTNDMVPFIDQYAPNYKARMGDLYKRFLDEKGEMHSLPNYWGILEITGYAPEIRYDWYIELGEPKIETPDDWYNVLKAMVNAHPTNSKGEKTYAFCFVKDRMSYEIAGSMWGLKKSWKDENGKLTYFLNTPEGLELTKYINRFYREGLLDPDSFIVTLDEWRMKIANERLAGHLDSWWVILATHDFWPDAIPNYDDRINRYIHVDVKAPGVEHSTFNPKDANGSYRTIVTDKCDDPAKIAKWLNFEATDLGIKLVGWGVPYEYVGKYHDGYNYAVWHFDGDKWWWNEERKQEYLENRTDYEKIVEMGQGVKHLSAYIAFNDDGSTYWFDQNFNDELEWKVIMNTNMKDSIFDFSAYYTIELTPDNPLSVKWQQIQDMTKTEWIQAVTSKTEAECVAKYNALVKKANNTGLKDVEQFYSTSYKATLDSWK